MKCSSYQNVFDISSWCIFKIQCHKVLSELAVHPLVHLVKDKIEEIESGNERRWQVYVSRNGQFDIIFGANGIGSCKDGCSGIQSRNNSGLGN